MGYPLGPAGGGGQTPASVDWTQGPKPRTVSVKAATASSELFTGVGLMMASSAAETTGSARALAYLHDGVDASGVIIGVLGCPSGSGTDIGPGWPGIYFQTGLYLEIVTGTITVSVTFVAMVDQLPN